MTNAGIKLAVLLSLAGLVSLNVRFIFPVESQRKAPEWKQSQAFSEWKQGPGLPTNLDHVLKLPPPWERASPDPRNIDPLSGEGPVLNATLRRLARLASDTHALRQPPTRVTLAEARALGPRVSPLLFGGFIEHMGRVIDGNFGNDGGIWAELLADRKFYFDLLYSSGKTTTPWKSHAGPHAEVTSPRATTALVRGGRVVLVRFPCPQEIAEIGGCGGGGGSKSPSSGPTAPGARSTLPPLRQGEVEQSGLPLERGRAYRGYFWARAGEANAAGDWAPAAGGSPTSVGGNASASVLAVEVWLRFPEATHADVLLARVVTGRSDRPADRPAGGSLRRPNGTSAGSASDADIGDTEWSAARNQSTKRPAFSDGPRLGAEWRRFEFGFVAPVGTRVDCECGLTSKVRTVHLASNC